MSTFLFDRIIFGPVNSRRLGISLGINLLPNNLKICTFNCIYCECGWTLRKELSAGGGSAFPTSSVSGRVGGKKADFPPKAIVKRALEEKLKEMKNNNYSLDIITFAGNGEPTIHSEFAGIIKDTIELKNKYFPDVKIAVLSNSTMLHKEPVFDALKKIDLNILKLDSGIEDTIKLISKPLVNFNIEETIKNLMKFEGNLIIQTLFFRGIYNGVTIDNTTSKEIDAWLKLIKKIKPKSVMIYTFARDTSAGGLKKVSINELNKIAEKVKKLRIAVQVSG